MPGSYGLATVAARIWISVTSPVARLRAHERRKMEKITALDERIAGFEAALRESMAAVEERTARLEASLQERMTALETTSQSCPGEVCLYCGGQSLRLKKASGPIGSGRGTWRRETWVCEACGKEDWRHRNFPD